MSCGKSTVNDIINKKEEFGSVKNLPRSGRPPVTTSSQDKYIRVTSLMDRFRPSHEIARNIINHKSKKRVSARTVRRRLEDVAKNKPKLTKRQKQARLEWARKHRGWTKSDWEKVLWSDESPFTLFVKGAPAR